MTNYNKTKGDNYELFVAEKIKNENNEVFLWKNIPENILYEINYINNWNKYRLEKIKYKLGQKYDNNHNYFMDTGVDIIVKENNNIKFIQCKCYDNSKLNWSDISTFLGMCFNYNKNGELYYTKDDCLNYNLIEHTQNLINNGKLKLIHFPNENIQQIPTFELRDYQVESSNLCKDFFVKNNRGTLSLPCGTGKTEIMIEISKNFELTIILSPLRILAKQTLERFQERLNLLKYQSKLVDSEGERNTLISGAKIISATFKSADIINEISKKVDLEKTLIIIDEFHNLCKNDIPIKNYNEDDENYDENSDESSIEEDDFDELEKEKTEIYKLLENQNNKILFVSATPRIYELEDENDVELGEIIYQMSLSEAIQKNLICDYKVYFPLIHNLESEFENYTNITNKITWFLNSICKLGLQKIIVFCESKDDIEEMKKEILLLQEYYALELKMDSITDVDSSIIRKEKQKNFENNNEVSILFSIRILDEGIDIPCCDSVFISYPSKAKIRNIQRIMRACRKYSTKNYAKILYWTDNEKDLDFLSSLKEFDPELKSKIKVSSNQYEEFESKEIKKKENKLIVQTIGIREYSWMNKYDLLKEYLKNNDFQNQTNKEFVGWIDRQRQNKKKNKLSDERIKLLEELNGWFWEVDLDKKWMEKYNSLKEYLKNNDFPKCLNKDFGIWIFIQRQKKKKNKLSDDKIKLLEKLKDWIWEVDLDEKWMKKYNSLKEYLQNNDFSSQLNKNFGCWINKQRQKKKENKLSEKQIQLLEELKGWFWKVDLNKKWMEKYNYLKEYLKNNEFPTESNKNFGCWVNKQRQKKKENKLSEKQTQLLEELNEWFWEINYDNQWMEKYNLLKEYLLTNNFPTSKNKDFGRWISTQKKNKKKEKLSNEKIQLLEKLNGWYWELDEKWIKKYYELKEYLKNNNFPTRTNKEFGNWIHHQKSLIRKKLFEDKIKLLKELPNWK
jgi:superfamily II DNA or RNA helicase